MDSRETDLNFDDRETGLMSAHNILSDIPIDHFLLVCLGQPDICLVVKLRTVQMG